MGKKKTPGGVFGTFFAPSQFFGGTRAGGTLLGREKNYGCLPKNTWVVTLYNFFRGGETTLGGFFCSFTNKLGVARKKGVLWGMLGGNIPRHNIGGVTPEGGVLQPGIMYGILLLAEKIVERGC